MCTTLSTVSLPLEILRVILVLRRERLGLAPCRRHVGVSPGAVATAVAAAGAPSECDTYLPPSAYLLADLCKYAVAGVRIVVSVARRVRLQGGE
eukprot:scaffold109636_cov90-Phaeocystis_antarctica.AAC.1